MSENSHMYKLRFINAKPRTDHNQDSHWQTAPNLYVKFRFPVSGSDMKPQKTDVIRKSYNPAWNKVFFIKEVKDTSSEVQFDLKCDSFLSLFQKPCFGTVKIGMNQLLLQSKDNLCKLDLEVVNKSDSRSKLGWSLGVQLTMNSVKDTKLIFEAIEGIQRYPHFSEIAGSSTHVAHGVSMIQDALDLVESQTSLVKAVEALLSKLSRVKSLVDDIAKIHPYLNAAWQVVSAIYKIVKAQYDRDQEVTDLVTAMIDAVSFIEDAQMIDQPHNQQQYLHKILSQIMPQINGFVERLRYQTLSDYNQMITDMKNNLFSFRNSLNSGTVVHTAITLSMILENVERSFLIQSLKPAEMDVTHRRHCLSDTRQEMIGSILGELLNIEPDTAQRVLWMYGPAGSGKSTLATTIANHFVEQHRRGAFVCFDRSRTEASKPKHVIRTIAYQLGLHDPFMRSALAHSIQEAGDIDTLGLSHQFSKLWVDPLCNAQEMHTRPGPIVVVIDALDECGTVEE
ncbi:hypothetical protein B0H21DRAFT_881090, partial [Amylocystis lapponica]